MDKTKKCCLVKSYCLKEVWSKLRFHTYFYIPQAQIAWNSFIHLNQTREYESFKTDWGGNWWTTLAMLDSSDQLLRKQQGFRYHIRVVKCQKTIGLADSQSSSMSFMTLTMDHMDHMDHLSTLKSPLLVPPIVVISLYVMIRHNTSFLNLSRGRNGPNSRTGLLWKDCLPKLQSPNGAFMEKSTIFTFSNEARWY